MALSLRKDACSLNLHSLSCLCKDVAHPPGHPALMPFPEWIPFQQSFSLGLSLILKKVAGGSGWLCPSPPPPTPTTRPEVGAGHVFNLFMSGIMYVCSPESKPFAK